MRTRTLLVRWSSIYDSDVAFDDKVDSALADLDGRRIVSVQYQESVAPGTGDDEGHFLVLRSALIVYEEEDA